MLDVSVPGRGSLRLEHLVLDVNGTLTHRGELIADADRLADVRERLTLHLVSADTFGNAETIARELGAAFARVGSGSEKRRYVERLGAADCVAVGNGANDMVMFEVAALSIAVIGPEGASARALAAADIVCSSLATALELLTEPRLLAATLRS
jgi:soluble P-type ATPase